MNITERMVLVVAGYAGGHGADLRASDVHVKCHGDRSETERESSIWRVRVAFVESSRVLRDWVNINELFGEITSES